MNFKIIKHLLSFPIFTPVVQIVDHSFCVGRDRVVGIETNYGLDGPWIESADPSGRAV